MAQNVRDFFKRYDASKIAAGKKMTVTRHKIRRQIPLLLDILANLHNQYKAESLFYISLTLFWRLKPFGVTYPTVRQENLQMQGM